MIVLDTDHLNVLAVPGPRCERLLDRLAASSDPDFAISVVTVEEQMRSWLAEIHRQRSILKQIEPYGRLAGLVGFWRLWKILPLDELAAIEFQGLRAQFRIGSQDLKIAAIALVNKAVLLTANTRDFERIPGLRAEDWLD